MSSKHTPEPWEAVVNSTCSGAWFSIRPDGDQDREICQTSCFAVNDTGCSETFLENPTAFANKADAQEVAANARLLATAPELLKTLRQLVNSIEEHDEIFPPDLGDAKLALAKAEGRQS